MFANILVPLDGSALSEHALPMAQHLARSSETALHLLQVISLRPELDALRGSGSESVTVLEMAQERTDKVSIADVQKHLDAVNLGSFTLQTMVFEPATLKLHLAIGAIPASALPLRTLDLAPLLKPDTRAENKGR